jgi:hypothetical protein
MRTRWGVCKPEVMQDHLDAGTFQITVDGQVRASGNLAEYRGEIVQEDWATGPVWMVYYEFPVGAFEAGSFHWLELERRYSRAVTDGCDSDQDGALDMFGPGYHEFGVVRLEVTVQ